MPPSAGRTLGFGNACLSAARRSVHSPAAAAPELSAEPAAEDVAGSFESFLTSLHERGFFGAGATDAQHATTQKADVKKALLALGRQRPDIIFSLDRDAVAAVAAATLPPKEKPERKMVAAEGRLKASFTGDAAAAEGAAVTAVDENNVLVNNQASFQDLLRVGWAWSREEQAVAAAAGSGARTRASWRLRSRA